MPRGCDRPLQGAQAIAELRQGKPLQILARNRFPRIDQLIEPYVGLLGNASQQFDESLAHRNGRCLAEQVGVIRDAAVQTVRHLHQPQAEILGRAFLM